MGLVTAAVRQPMAPSRLVVLPTMIPRLLGLGTGAVEPGGFRAATEEPLKLGTKGVVPLVIERAVRETLALGSRGEQESSPSGQEAESPLPAKEWAVRQYAGVDLGNGYLNRRVPVMAAKMAACPEGSLPNQMGSHANLIGAYRLLNNESVTMEALLAPSCRRTLAEASRCPVVLMVEDTTELDFTAHPSKTGLGPIGDGKGRGLLLHSTLAVVPEGRRILGLAHAQVVLRQPKVKGAPRWKRTPEAQVWETSARAVGRAPQGKLWVHVGDRGSDIFEYMAAVVDLDKEFLVRAFHNRVLGGEEGVPRGEEATEARHLLDLARNLLPCSDPGATYTLRVPAHKKKPAREARVAMQWTEVTIPPPAQAPAEVRCHAPLKVSLLRVWEVDPPQGAERVEWILLSSLPITTVEEALRAVDWYCCRWICEDYHQCLKTGCRVEDTQLDDGADISRLLGFDAPIAVRLLQLRQAARQTPDLPAKIVVDPLMVEVLALHQHKDAEAMTIAQFWRLVAAMGGHQGRRRDGPPGWRTVWKGWRHLAEMTEGARLVLTPHTMMDICSV